MTTATKPTTDADAKFGKRTAPFNTQLQVEQFIARRGFADADTAPHFAAAVVGHMPDEYRKKSVSRFSDAVIQPIPAELIKAGINATLCWQDRKARGSVVSEASWLLGNLDCDEAETSALQSVVDLLAPRVVAYLRRYEKICEENGLKPANK